MLEKIENLLLYSNLGKDDYESVSHKISKENRLTVNVVTLCGIVIITAMYVSTYFVSGIENNRYVYLAGALLLFVVLMLSHYYSEDETITPLLVYSTYFVFYTYGIAIGIITEPQQKTVAFIVMLVFLPILFIDVPIRSVCVTGFYTVVFVFLCTKVKSDALLQKDVVNAITFSVLGVFSGILVSRAKVRSFILEHNLKISSRTDELTQMNNRNLYQKRVNSDYFSLISEKSLTCIYVDVNGLHDFNNAEGHDKGDEMLRVIADEIKAFFGEELTFRIGGDEFAIFVPDLERKDIKDRLEKMVQNIELAGYHVAIGMATMGIDHLSMETLIKTADYKMYQDKNRYYSDSAHDRRKK